MKDFVLDRSALSIGSFADEPDDLSYWLNQTPATTMLFYGMDAHCCSKQVNILRPLTFKEACYDPSKPRLLDEIAVNKISHSQLVAGMPVHVRFLGAS